MTNNNLEFRAFVTNLGKYNEGVLIGEWVEFPVSEEEIEEVFDHIGINEEYEEYFITDYDGDWAGGMKPEYISIDELNRIVEHLQEFNDSETLAAALEVWLCSEILEMNPENFYLSTDIHDQYDLGYYWAVESGCYDIGPDKNPLLNYIDYEAFGRDIALESNGDFTEHGYIEYIG